MSDINEWAINPFKQLDSNVRKPFTKLDSNIDSKYNYAILKTTDNGKWVRGNLLFYNFNGVNIYTELNNIILINEISKTVYIKEYDKVIKELTPNSPEEKQYIALYTDLGYEESEESFPLRWEAQQGRTNIYECIRSNIGVIDLDKSIVCVDSVPLKDSLTVREFVSYVNNAGYINEEDQIDLEMYD